jgi:hypothetical protein
MSRSPHPPAKRRLTQQQRRALELLAGDPHGSTDGLLVPAESSRYKVLAGLVHEGFASALVGEIVETDGQTIEAVRIMITEAGRRAIEG